MIKVETTVSLPEEKRNVLKAELGKAISILDKPESYLMINLVDHKIYILAETSLIKVLLLK